MNTQSNAPLTVDSPVLAELRNHIENQVTGYSFQEYVDNINQRPSVVAALNEFSASAGQSMPIAVNQDSLSMSNVYTLGSGEIRSSLVIAQNSLETPTRLVRVLAHEVSGHHLTSNFIATATDPSNPLYDGKTSDEIRSLVTEACYAAEFLGYIAEYRAGQEGPYKFSASGFLGLHQKIADTIKSIEGSFPGLAAETVNLATAKFLASNYSSNDVSHAEQCRRWAEDVIKATPDAEVKSEMSFQSEDDGDVSLRLSTASDVFGTEIHANGSRETTVTSADGDQTQSHLGSDGGVVKVVEIDGAGDDADYNTRTTTYDAEGRVDAIETVRDDDSRDVINLDQDGTQPWSRFEAHVDTEGREDFSVATMDDGSSVYSDFDQTGASGNSLWQSGTDAEGRVDWVKATTDEGAVNWVDYDQANAHVANRWESHIDSQGRVDWTSTVSEDGSTVRVDYDETGALDWARSELRLDENGLIDYVNTFGDDGSSTWSDYDQGNTRGDSLYQVGTDAHGRTDWVNVTADDGSRNWLDYDQGNVDGSATWGSHIDAQGRTDWIEVTADDGTRHWLDYDQSGEHIWSSVETWFDPGGTKDQRTIHEDNGSRTHYEYFPEVHPDAHAITYFYPDGHGAGGRIIYDGYSHVLEINGGNNPEWPDSTYDSFNYSTDASVDFRYAPEPYY